MSYWADVRDWLGGYPYEDAKIEEVLQFARKKLNMDLINIKTVNRSRNIFYIAGKTASAYSFGSARNGATGSGRRGAGHSGVVVLRANRFGPPEHGGVQSLPPEAPGCALHAAPREFSPQTDQELFRHIGRPHLRQSRSSVAYFAGKMRRENAFGQPFGADNYILSSRTKSK